MKRIEALVCYDVNTMHEDGKKRLRKVAKTCEAYGQRVQWSVFEVKVTSTDFEKMVAKIYKIMDSSEDSLRVYLLSGSRESYLNVYGRDGWVNFEAPIVV